MRLTLFAALAASPLLLLAAQDIQDPQDQEGADLRNPFEAFRQDEAARIDKQLQGAWMLMNYGNPDVLVEQENVRGFFIFHDGYMMLTLQAVEIGPGFLGTQRDYTVQSGAYRYRIVDGTHLQTAGMLGFTNANEAGEIDFSAVLEPEEYRITVDETDLTLVRSDHRSFTFRRLQRSEFPESSIRRLERMRGGGLIDDTDGLGLGDR